MNCLIRADIAIAHVVALRVEDPFESADQAADAALRIIVDTIGEKPHVRQPLMRKLVDGYGTIQTPEIDVENICAEEFSGASIRGGTVHGSEAGAGIVRFDRDVRAGDEISSAALRD